MTVQVGTVIRERRRAVRMSQTELARALGFSQSQLSKIESNQTDVSMDLLAKICSVLDADISTFVASVEDDATVWYGYETLVHLQQLAHASEHKEVLRIIDKAVGAEFFQHRHNAVRLLYWKAVAYNGLREPEAVENACVHLLDSYSNVMDASLMAAIYVEYAWSHLLRHDGDNAHVMLKKALDICSANPAVKSDVELMRTLDRCRGEAYWYQGKLDDASECFKRASRLDHNIVYRVVRRAGLSVLDQGSVAAVAGKYKEALALFKEAIRQFTFIGATKEIALAQNNIAYTLKEMGRLEESEALYQQIIKHCKHHPEDVTPEVRLQLEAEGYQIDA